MFPSAKAYAGKDHTTFDLPVLAPPFFGKVILPGEESELEIQRPGDILLVQVHFHVRWTQYTRLS